MSILDYCETYYSSVNVLVVKLYPRRPTLVCVPLELRVKPT